MKHTLIAFHCTRIDLEKDKSPTELAVILSATEGNRVEVYPGCYVFDTQKDSAHIHRLCEWLRSRNRTFLRLPFEGAFYAYVPPKSIEALTKLGVEVHSYPEGPIDA